MTTMTASDLYRFGTSFSRNPYSGTPIAKCTDQSVLCWKLNNRVVNPKNSDRVKEAELIHRQERLKELGGGQDNEGRWVDSKLFARISGTSDAHKFFSCNPCKGQSIEECEDLGLMCWKLNRDAFDYETNARVADQERSLVQYTCESRGCQWVEGQWYTPDQVNADWFQDALEKKHMIENGEPLTIEMKYNINADGTLRAGLGCVLFFQHKYNAATYYAPGYALPLDNSGAAKRVKGRTIRVNSYEYNEETGNYDVKNWEFAD